MDFLKAEIEKKKKAISTSGGSTSSGAKWFKQGDLKQQEAKELLKKQEQLGNLITWMCIIYLLEVFSFDNIYFSVLKCMIHR